MGSSNLLKMTFLDVGQGDSLVVELPNKKVWVIDGGGIQGSDLDVGRAVVAPFLWQKNIRKVDALILSHPHHDHYKGLEFLLKNFSPQVLYWNGVDAPDSESEDWREFLEALKASGVTAVPVTRATPILTEGEVQLKFLMPESSGTKPHWETNDNSIVAALSYRDIRVLLVGDLMREGEVSLLEKGVSLRSDVLKLGHHGSRTSTTDSFLEAVRPQFAILSSGRFNQYGIPDEEVLERLADQKVTLFRTDIQGAIELTTEGKVLLWSPLVH